VGNAEKTPMVDVLKSADFIEKIEGSELKHVQCMLFVVIIVLGMHL